ncbi:recombinase family protein [Cohnella nanjingensis]|uniref:Recombinase family protein n=1 Tax=Cohnella nanjingensis TaxID=1387779 RepID=A0A7X0RPY6_9BACL|nr:recombinase family protein [Cohnella nanjingensis]
MYSNKMMFSTVINKEEVIYGALKPTTVGARRGQLHCPDSLLSQLQILTTKVRRWGTVAEIYVDTSPVSMFNRDRPGLSMLLADMRRERFDAILVTEIWRLFRNAESVILMIRK